MKKITKKLLLVILGLFIASPSCFGMNFGSFDDHEDTEFKNYTQVVTL